MRVRRSAFPFRVARPRRAHSRWRCVLTTLLERYSAVAHRTLRHWVDVGVGGSRLSRPEAANSNTVAARTAAPTARWTPRFTFPLPYLPLPLWVGRGRRPPIRWLRLGCAHRPTHRGQDLVSTRVCVYDGLVTQYTREAETKLQGSREIRLRTR